MSLSERVLAGANRFYLRVRDRRAWNVSKGPAEAMDFAALKGHTYCLLITYRESGKAVPTPVWFGLADGKVYASSESKVGKVKRIRANGRARIAPCTFRGKPLGPAADGRARVLPSGEEDQAEAAIAANYGRGRSMYHQAGERMGMETVYLEIAPLGEGV